MKHAVMVAVHLTGGVLNARADSNVWKTTTKYARSDAQLHAASASCAQIYGAPDNGTKSSPQFKRCMLGPGGGSATPCAGAPGVILKPD